MSVAVLYPGFRRNEPTVAGRAIVRAESHAAQLDLLIPSGTASQYYRGDKDFAELNQAAVAGLRVTDSPTFDGITANGLRVGVNTRTIQSLSTAEVVISTSQGSAAGLGFATGCMIRSPLRIRNASNQEVNLECGGTDIVEQRRGTNGQRYDLSKTWTSATDLEALRFDAAALDGATPVYRIGSRVGSIGGVNREIQIGQWDASNAWSTYLRILTNGRVIVNNGVYLAGGDNGMHLRANAAGNVTEFWRHGTRHAGISQDLIEIGPVGGTGQVRLGRMDVTGGGGLRIRNSSNALTILQAIIRTHAAAVAETPAATHTLVIEDSTGTPYKVLAVAA